MLLLGPGQEARHINKSDQRDVEGITEADEAAVQSPCVIFKHRKFGVREGGVM
jgi:hypothetical protein